MAVATNDFNLQIAKQSGKGAAAAAPAYFLELMEGGLKSPPTVDAVNTMDGGIWTPSHKRIGYVDAGGAPVMMVTPAAVGLLLYAAMGAIASSGAGSTYTHTITPATSMAGFPYLSGWQEFDSNWTFFRDLQITGMVLECAVAQKFMRMTPTFVGMAKEKFVAAPTPAAAEADQYHWLDAEGYWCIDGDFTNCDHSSNPTDLTTLVTWLTAFKTTYNAHMAAITGMAARHHKAADTTNTLAYTNPTTQGDCDTALATIKTKYNAHVASTTFHYFADTTNTIGYTNPVGLAQCLAAVEEILGYVNAPGDYNKHCGAVAAVRNLRFEVNMASTPLQGESMVPYTVKRKRGAFNCAVELLLEDFQMMNLVKFGNPAPSAGTEITSEIQRGSLAVKFIASTNPERSVKLLIPQFDFDPAGVMDTTGNPEGDEIYLTLGGEASLLTGNELATVIVLNGVVSY